MKVLVTGGAGYIGSHVVQSLLVNGDTPIVIDNLSQGHRSAIPNQVAFIEADLANRPQLENIFSTYRPDAVIHFASHTLVGESTNYPFKYLREKGVNGLNVIECALKYGTGKFVLSSTANLFNDVEKFPISEEEKVVPGSPYGESKAILERILYWADMTKGLKYVALRYFNACGCGYSLGEDHDPETHLIPIVLQVALGQREKVTIFGNDYPTQDGTCVRDYIHVLDLADAHIKSLYALDDRSLTYNLGSGTGYSVQEIIEASIQITGKEIPTEIGSRREGDPPILIASSQKITNEIGWKPKYSDLNTIISSAWEWMKTHPNGYEE